MKSDCFCRAMWLVAWFSNFWVNPILCSVSPNSKPSHATITIDSQAISGNLPRLWESTGLSPGLPHHNASKFLLSPDMSLNLAYVGTMGFVSEMQVRIHWLLDLIRVRGWISTHKEIFPIFDFSQLDALIEMLHVNGLKPGFEVMGNPGDIFDNFENETQCVWMRDLCHAIASRYITKYGISSVLRWNFETWNEPDHAMTWDSPLKNISVSGYLNYFEAVSSGLRGADPRLRLSGPGGSCRPPNFTRFCYALLELCNNVKHGGPCLDFISFHKKGGKGDMKVEASRIIESELETLAVIHRRFPNLRFQPIYNDEAWWGAVCNDKF